MNAQSAPMARKFEVSRRGLLVGAGLAAGLAAVGGDWLGPSSASAAGSTVWPNGTATRPTITSSFGPRTPPFPGASSYHQGTDMVGFSSIRAVEAGTVKAVGVLPGWERGGYQILIQHNGFTSRYLHMVTNSALVGVGQGVNAGTAIGTMGSTGAYDVHLHLEINTGNGQIDPVPFLTNRINNAPQPESIGGVKEIAVRGSGWSAIPVGQTMSSVFTAVNQGSGWGDLYGSFGGRLQLVGVSGGAWTRMDSGLPLNASSLVALNVGQGYPHIFAVENTTLFHIHADSAGWHKQSTGLTVQGKISGVVLPGNNVQLVANIGGLMHHITTHSGWQIMNSGTPIGDEFKAVNVDGVLQIVTALNGVIHIIWPGAGWQLQSSGQPTSGSLTAVDMGGGYPTVIANEGWSIVVTSVSGGGWVRQAMGVATSGRVDALNLGGSYPVIYAV